MLNTSRALYLGLVLPAAGCFGNFELSVTSTVTTDGVVDPAPPKQCGSQAGGGVGIFTVSPGNYGTAVEPFVVDAPFDNDTVAVTISVGADVVAEDQWNTSDIGPDFVETVTATSGTSSIEVKVEGVGCGD
jgi:hypothetical protein